MGNIRIWQPPEGFAWLDGQQPHLGRARSFWGIDPVAVATDLSTYRKYQDRYIGIGYFGYPLRRHFEPVPVVHPPPFGFPDLWMAFYDRVWMAERNTIWEIRADGRRTPVHRVPFPPPPAGAGVRFSGATVDRDGYIADVAWLRERIAAGDIFQANYTFGVEVVLEDPPWHVYGHLRQKQPTAYGAYLQIDADRAVLSCSPELFFRWENGRILTAPMKGTRPRGSTPDEDERLRIELKTSLKDRAENVMIVDLMRNDFGRIARIGTVHVPELFRVEAYPTVFQMISIVTAEVRPDVDMVAILRATFPPGSVTGAPKVKAMELLARCEKAERGVYCGCIGIVFPWREAVLNVVIRTLQVHGTRGWYGTGGGIVIDSDPVHEWREAWQKTRFLWDASTWRTLCAQHAIGT